jgi:hypothetical protein
MHWSKSASVALLATLSVASAFTHLESGARGRPASPLVRSGPVPSSAAAASAAASRYTASSRRFMSSSGSADDDKETSSKDGFSLSNLFGATSAAKTALRGATAATAEHPSVRDHVSPLNLLYPGGRDDPAAPRVVPDRTGEPLPVHPDVKSGVLKNGLSYVILPNKSPPGRFEAHLQVFSGSCELWSVVALVYIILHL